MKQIMSCCALLLLLVSPLHSYADDTQWIADKRGCKVANIAPQDGESIAWSGECKNGLAHGEGTLNWFQKGVKVETYNGSMVNGYAEGRGQLKRGSGVYIGEWKKSMQHGKGRFEDADGSWYQGEWEEGLPPIRLDTNSRLRLRSDLCHVAYFFSIRRCRRHCHVSVVRDLQHNRSPSTHYRSLL